jgi:hypothetical protein
MQNQKVSDTTILATGIGAWLLLAFASIKLAVIYARNPALAYLLAYNISAFIFLVYFIGYFKEKFRIGYFLLLAGAYNVGINLLHLLYNRLFLLESPPFEYERMYVSCIINIPLLTLTWLLLYWFIRRKK